MMAYKLLALIYAPAHIISVSLLYTDSRHMILLLWVTLLECLSMYAGVNRTVVILGDFKLPRIDWESVSCSSDIVHQEFLNILGSHHSILKLMMIISLIFWFVTTSISYPVSQRMFPTVQVMMLWLISQAVVAVTVSRKMLFINGALLNNCWDTSISAQYRDCFHRFARIYEQNTEQIMQANNLAA